jgi:uncharacterized protein (DUF2062 family)
MDIASLSASASGRRGLASWVRRRARYLFDRLKNEHSSPRRLGVAVAVGVLVGCSPFLGLQLLLAVGLATLLGLNRFAVLLGAQISTPPVTPVLLYFNLQIGAILLTGRWRPLSFEAVRDIPATHLAAELFSELFVGGLLVGGILAAGLGCVTTALIQRNRSRKPLRDFFTFQQWEQLQSRLESLPPRWRSYARWKLRLDPVYALMLAELPEDTDLLDLGTGMGLLPLLLAIRSPAVRIRAVEWDARKTRIARKLLDGLSVDACIQEGDARQYPLSRARAVSLVDVLHYNPVEEQKVWLTRCAKALEVNGILLIRDLESATSRWPWTRLLEVLAVRLGWNRGGHIQVWPPAEMARTLTQIGFVVERRQAGSGVFRANTLLIARKGPNPY